MAQAESEVISRLPPDLQTILKRKSSRDPQSRFTSKLLSLLAYVSSYPSMEDSVGVAWVDENIFKMNKKTLSTILSIKPNTLNVNLRDLKFEPQSGKAKDGWTLWKKDQFSRSSAPAQAEAPAAKPADVLFHLGCVQPNHVTDFFSESQMIWRQLTNATVSSPVSMPNFLRKAAARFKQEGQEEQNALDVLTAIMSPKNSDTIAFEQLARFLAMFGPERTIMLKIASLLNYSQKSRQWLYFDTDLTHTPAVYGMFDASEPNCLVIHSYGTISKVWNLPLTDMGQGKYLIDERGRQYGSWAEYFEAHPVNGAQDSDLLSYI